MNSIKTIEFRRFLYCKGILNRYAAVKKEGRVVVRIYRYMGSVWIEKAWFTPYRRQAGKRTEIKEPLIEGLEKYMGHHWSLSIGDYEKLIKLIG